MKTENQTESTLQNFMTYGSSLCGAFAAAALESFRGGMAFDVSVITLIAAIVGFGAFVAFWKLFFSERKTTSAKILFAMVIGFLIAGGAAGVLYPLRFVAGAELPNLITGLAAAAFALTGGALLLYVCKRFFDADARSNQNDTTT